jgi:hypothetical protein
MLHLFQFAPRIGIAYRVSDTFVIRTGYGITNDPYNLARPLRTNYPVLFVFNQEGANSFAAAGSLRTGIPALAAPDLGNGIIDVPRNAAVNSLLNEFTRGYIQSWNFTLQKQLGANWSAQAGYVATRSIRQLGFLDLNTAQPGGGNASRLFNQKFGRTVDTRVVGSLGNAHYDSLQTSIERRFSSGAQFRVGYTWGKAIGNGFSVSALAGKREFLGHGLAGALANEAAQQLAIALDTVRGHVKSIYEKLHVQSRTEAVIKVAVQRHQHVLEHLIGHLITTNPPLKRHAPRLVVHSLVQIGHSFFRSQCFTDTTRPR